MDIRSLACIQGKIGADTTVLLTLSHHACHVSNTSDISWLFTEDTICGECCWMMKPPVVVVESCEVNNTCTIDRTAILYAQITKQYTQDVC